jgi:hypothetical protein
MKSEIPPTETGVGDDVLREVWRIKDDLNRLFAEARERQRDSGRSSVNLQAKKHEEAKTG